MLTQVTPLDTGGCNGTSSLANGVSVPFVLIHVVFTALYILVFHLNLPLERRKTPTICT